ncbi:MAG: hypothetical protein Q7R57_04940 [Dehalococcoidales bacterium]|nr:hypothetical protein [Dehalococcoidales bacterium]
MRSFVVAFFLTARSIGRGNIGVTLLTVLMLTLANLNLIFVPSLINGIVRSANDKLITTYSGNIIIEARSDNTRNDPPLIRNADELISQISQIVGVAGVTYRNSIGADLAFGDEHSTAVIKGAPPEREKQVFDIAGALVEGSYLEPRDMDQILLGVQVAGNDRPQIEFYSSSLKKVHAGDKISVNYGNGIKKQYKVKGIFYTEFVQTDLQAFVSNLEFKSVNPLVNNRAATIHIKVNDDSQTRSIIDQISSLRDGLKFKTWQETAGIITSMTDSFMAINGIITAVNLLVAGITVFIVTYIDLAHKRRQIGIERAIGITPAAITLSYVFRAMFCAILGIIASWLLYHYVVVPLEIRHPFHFPFGNVTLFAGEGLIVRSALIILGVATFAAFLPVRQTIRIKILDAIWG